MTKSKYPDDLRRYVFTRYAKGKSATAIHRAVTARWPEHAKMTRQAIYMMISRRKQAMGYSSLPSAPISLCGPDWSIPEGCIAA